MTSVATRDVQDSTETRFKKKYSTGNKTPPAIKAGGSGSFSSYRYYPIFKDMIDHFRTATHH